MGNASKRNDHSVGLWYIVLLLLNVLALREAYKGNQYWHTVHITTLPLLLSYFHKVQQRKS